MAVAVATQFILYKLNLNYREVKINLKKTPLFVTCVCVIDLFFCKLCNYACVNVPSALMLAMEPP